MGPARCLEQPALMETRYDHTVECRGSERCWPSTRPFVVWKPRPQQGIGLSLISFSCPLLQGALGLDGSWTLGTRPLISSTSQATLPYRSPSCPFTFTECSSLMKPDVTGKREVTGAVTCALGKAVQGAQNPFKAQ